MKLTKSLVGLAVSAALGAPLAAHATNGMDMEGYGPIATAMGGASMAYDNGTAAMMNNPSTLSLMSEGDQLDLAFGELSPDVKSSYPAMGASWKSSADAFYMPAAGWARKRGNMTFGVGVFAQGGMGTQYDDGGAGTAFVQAAISGAGGDPTAVSSWRERSEVGVMRVLFPLSVNVNDKLTVGGSLDYVRATMDLQMAMPYSMMSNMMAPGSTVGSISVNSAMGTALTTLGSAGPGGIYGGYFNFSDNKDYDGVASSDGYAGKLGFTYRVNPALTIGGVYQSKTSLSDMTGDATMEVAYDMGGTTAVYPVSGKITIKDFEWPETYGLGLSYHPNDKWMLAADVKQIKWSDVMKNFKMTFTANSGAAMDATLYQNWDDQTVWELGGSYAVNDALTLRAGANLSKNPIPDSTVSYLFPAIIENHYTVGFGYAFSKANRIDFSTTYAPKVTVTGTNASSNKGLVISHAQTNWQFMYSHKF